MSHQGYSPNQHYVPPPQPQYAQQEQLDGDGNRQYYATYGTSHSGAGSHATGGSYTTVSSLGTGLSQTVVDYHVSGPGTSFNAGSGAHDYPAPQHATSHAIGSDNLGHRPSVRPGGEPVFEMPAEPAQQLPVRPKVDQDPRRNETTEQTPVQANPWPFYLDVSPTRTKKVEEDLDGQKAELKEDAKQEPIQAFPWPYHGPTTEDEDEPRATVHPPRKETLSEGSGTAAGPVKGSGKDEPLPSHQGSRLNEPLPPAGKDESVLDDILADMDAQDEDEEDEVQDGAQRLSRDPTLRPPPLNLSRPYLGDGAKPNIPSGAASPGGRKYIPYRPGASPTASPKTHSPPHQQQSHQVPLVTAPHHVYMPHTQASLSPPPHPMAPHSPTSASPASGGGFSPYRPPSPQPPLSTPSTGLGIHQPQYHGGIASPALSGGDPAGFVPYQTSTSPRPGRSPSQTHSGLTSPTHPISPSFSPPPHAPSPRPLASPKPSTSPRPSHTGAGVSTGFDGAAAAADTPYPSSPPRVQSPPDSVMPTTAGSQGRPASPPPMAFYPPVATQQQHLPTEPVPGRLASPPVGPPLSRPSSRNESGSVHSGVSSTMEGAPVYPPGSSARPSQIATSTTGGSQHHQHSSPQLGSQHQYQQPPQQSPMPSPSYNIPQQTYASPTASSPHTAASPDSPPPPPHPKGTHSTTLPSPIPTPLSPPPPYTAIDLPPRPGSQPAAGSSYQHQQSYPLPSSQLSQFPPQPTYVPNQGYQHHSQSNQQPLQHQSGLSPPNLNQALPLLPTDQALPPLPPRPSTSHNGGPPPPPPRPQGFGKPLPNAHNFPPPPKPNYNSNNGLPPPMPPRPHHQNSYGPSHHNKLFGSSSAKKWIDKTERFVEQTFGDILQPQVDQGYRPPGGPGGYHQGPPPQGGHGHAPPQPQYAPPPSGNQQQYPNHHRPLPQQGPYPEMSRGRGRR